MLCGYILEQVALNVSEIISEGWCFKSYQIILYCSVLDESASIPTDSFPASNLVIILIRLSISF